MFGNGTPKAANIDRYCDELRKWHRSWQELISYFYDGRILRMYEAGSQFSTGKGLWNPGKLIERHMSRVIASMASGAGTRSTYNRMLLEHSSRHLIWGVKDADFFAVKSGGYSQL